ncbi:hypothetical protein Tco_0417038 [Tanacetum coccineum]
MIRSATCHHLSGATWHFHCSPPLVNRRSTTVGPPVNGGQRWSTAVNTAGPPVNGGGQRRVLALETSKTAQDLVIKKLKKKVKRLEKMQRARTPRMKLFKIGTSRRKSFYKENVSKQGRNLKTRSMFEEGDFDDDFDDIDDMVNEEMENVEGDIVNAGGAVKTATTGVSVASASVTTASVSISTAEPRTPPATTTTTFEDEDLTILKHL